MPLKKRKMAARKKVGKRKVTKRRPAVKPRKRKPAVKKSVRRLKRKLSPKLKRAVSAGPKQEVLGVITHYFPKVRAAVIKLKAPLTIGETIRIKGHTTDFTEAITSMQIDHVSVSEAKKGAEIGLLVRSRVRQHDVVYRA